MPHNRLCYRSYDCLFHGVKSHKDHFGFSDFAKDVKKLDDEGKVEYVNALIEMIELQNKVLTSKKCLNYVVVLPKETVVSITKRYNEGELLKDILKEKGASHQKYNRSLKHYGL